MSIVIIKYNPYSAMVSGIKRHATKHNTEDVARIWLSDFQFHNNLEKDSIVVTFDELVSDPTNILSRVSEYIMPLDQKVFNYASRVNRPERMGPDWWKSKVDNSLREEVEHWGKELKLMDIYNLAKRNSEQPGSLSEKQSVDLATHPLLKPFITVKKKFFQAWYRITRRI